MRVGGMHIGGMLLHGKIKTVAMGGPSLQYRVATSEIGTAGADFDHVWVNEVAMSACIAYVNAIEKALAIAVARVGDDIDRIMRRTFEGQAWRTQIAIDGEPAFEIQGVWDDSRFTVTTTECL